MTPGRRLALRAASWTVLAAGLSMPKLRPRMGLPRPIALGIVAVGPAAAAVGIPRSRWRSYAVFLAGMWAYLRAFELTYTKPERLGRRLVIDAPIAADRALGAGRTPTQRLQSWREHSPRRELADRLIGGVYFAWAAQRHAVMLWLLRRHQGRFARGAALVGASFDVAWVSFSVVPVAPPWWAAKRGRLPGVRARDRGRERCASLGTGTERGRPNRYSRRGPRPIHMGPPRSMPRSITTIAEQRPV